MAANRIIIVGGGISGLATAWFLARHGIESAILEKADRLGGLIKTDHLDGCDLEAGPDSYISTKPAVADLAKEIDGLSARIIGSNDDRRRVFVVKDGQLVPLPSGMVMIAPGQWASALQSPLFTTATKLRFLKERLAPPKQRAGDVSVSDFVKEHFGTQVLDYVAEPLLSGVYGGNVASLSVQTVMPRFLEYERKYGSLIKGVRSEPSPKHSGSLFRSFAGGMQTLTDEVRRTLTERVTVIHGEATNVTKSGAGWRVGTKEASQDATHVVLACPAHITAQLLESNSTPLVSELAAIPYSSAVLVMLVFDRAQVHHPLDGFGFLVPRKERRLVAAATWINTKFPSRIRPGLCALRAFIVDTDAENCGSASDQELTILAQAEFKRLMGIDATPVFSTIHRWPKSMPQYIVGHQQRRNRIDAALADLPGLHLGGNAFDGVGIPDCIARAKRIAAEISNQQQR